MLSRPRYGHFEERKAQRDSAKRSGLPTFNSKILGFSEKDQDRGKNSVLLGSGAALVSSEFGACPRASSCRGARSGPTDVPFFGRFCADTERR